MNLETLLLLSFQKYVMTSALSPTYSHLLVNNFHLLQLCNVKDGARLDVAVKGFWGICHQKAFLMFNPHVPSYRGSNLQPIVSWREKYEQHIHEVEMATKMGCFTPSVFSTFKGISTSSTFFCKRLASLVADKKDPLYCTMMSWLSSYSLLCSAIDCL